MEAVKNPSKTNHPVSYHFLLALVLLSAAEGVFTSPSLDCNQIPDISILFLDGSLTGIKISACRKLRAGRVWPGPQQAEVWGGNIAVG